MDTISPERRAEELYEALVEAGTPPEVLVDGRRLRTERGRRSVVAATLRLIRSGDPEPTFADIAGESGISERTIFRYFPGRDALLAAVAGEVFPQIAYCLEAEPIAGDLHARLDRLVSLRLDFVEVGGPTAAAVEHLASRSELAATLLRLRRQHFEVQVRNWLAPELDGREPTIASVIDVLLSMSGIGRLIDRFDRETVHETLVTSVLDVLRRAT